ncbi:uncharacterized protein LOC130810027 isoform X2 [Amaranthus tricolor]|uniref:uncharacterized protein LOC130810027 isoform X2 n=1 Tax=Amaranthus tricolor TaxID=29722 RepID=UPI00258937C0|nr:uncharacterized protein LOC130810027 isoform X2 [Amaranthus tricolor]
MGSKDGSVGWSVFDTIKFLPATPDALMAEINAAIAALEYAQASTQLAPRAKSSNSVPCSVYDAEIAEEAYKLGCIALSEVTEITLYITFMKLTNKLYLNTVE